MGPSGPRASCPNSSSRAQDGPIVTPPGTGGREKIVQNNLTTLDLTDIRDAVPQLDLVAIRALRRAGFDLVRCEPAPAQIRNLWNHIPHPMQTAVLRQDAPVS